MAQPFKLNINTEKLLKIKDMLIKPKRLVALDMGSSQLKLAEFSFKKGRTPFLENFVFFPVSDNAIEQGDLVNAEVLTEALPEFISQNTEGPFSKLYVSMSGRSIIVKKIELPRSEKELMDNLVAEEVSQNLPFNLDEINYDYMQIDSPPPPGGNKMNILLVAAKRDIVDNISQLIEDVGYRLAAIDMSAFGLSECMKFIHPDCKKSSDNILVLDIGKSGTMFIVLNRGDLIFSRYMMIGSDHYTVSLMKAMDIEYQEAESLKTSWCSGEETPPEVNRVMAESDHYFCDEIFIGCEYFNNQFSKEEFSKMYVTGGGSKIQSLIQALSKKFNLPTEVLDPFKKLQANTFLEDSLNHIKHFAPAVVGVCLRGV